VFGVRLSPGFIAKQPTDCGQPSCWSLVRTTLLHPRFDPSSGEKVSPLNRCCTCRIALMSPVETGRSVRFQGEDQPQLEGSGMPTVVGLLALRCEHVGETPPGWVPSRAHDASQMAPSVGAPGESAGAACRYFSTPRLPVAARWSAARGWPTALFKA